MCGPLTRPEVHVAAPEDVCRARNTDAYPDDVFDNLIVRYEEPNGMARWDSPLFTVPHGDGAPDVAGIWAALVGATKAPQNYATVLTPAVENDYLYELDRTTQEVVALVLEHQRSAGGAAGGVLPVGECETVCFVCVDVRGRVAGR